MSLITKEMSMMTVCTAWQYLAEAWATVDPETLPGGSRPNPSQICWSGLCKSIRVLMWPRELITPEVATRMRNMLYTYEERRGDGPVYYWELGDWKSRAEFCQSMVKHCVENGIP